MFVDEADKTCLRQGDILGPMPFPLLKAADLSFYGKMDPPEPGRRLAFVPFDENFGGKFKCLFPVRICFAAVLSQCCDIAPREGNRIVGQHTISLARLIEIPERARRDGQQLDTLRANANPLPPGAPFLNLFHVTAHAALHNQEWAVDYSQVFCIPTTDFPKVLERKLLQMTDDARIRFKIKLSTLYGRLTPEELASGHEWLRTV